MAEDLRAVLRLAAGRKAEPSAAILDSLTLRATPESGERAGYDGAKRRQGSELRMAVETLGHLLALHVTPANADDRAQVEHLAKVDRLSKAVQAATDDNVEVAFVDQGYIGQTPATAARRHGIELEVVKLPEAKRGFVLLPRRWVVERSFAWATRFRGSSKTTSDMPARWQTRTSLPSSASSSKRQLYSLLVHNSVWKLDTLSQPAADLRRIDRSARCPSECAWRRRALHRPDEGARRGLARPRLTTQSRLFLSRG